MDDLVSERAKVARDWEDFLYKNLSICNSDRYDEEKNPFGYINFGASINHLCKDIVHPRLNDIWRCDLDSLGYKEGWGTLKLRTAMANMMTKFLETYEPVCPNDLFCLTGVTSCIDVLGHCLADPGECFLVPAPMYSRIVTNFKQRALVNVFPIYVLKDNEDPGLTIEKIISAYESAVLQNNVVRGILLINPNNPLGDMYSPELLMDVLSFCNSNSLHLIVDEIYALSAFSTTEKFHSILKFPQLPDPDRTHVLYGLSKDFGIAGLRVGVIHTKCNQLKKCLYQLSYFQCIPYPLMETVATLIEDLEWCKKVIETNQKRLKENNALCANYLSENGIKIRKCPAGYFLWMDLREFCGSSFDGERDLFNHFLDNFRLYVGPGERFFSAQPGWFRIVISHNHSTLKEGLRRLKEGLDSYESPKE